MIKFCQVNPVSCFLLKPYIVLKSSDKIVDIKVILYMHFLSNTESKRQWLVCSIALVTVRILKSSQKYTNMPTSIQTPIFFLFNLNSSLRYFFFLIFLSSFFFFFCFLLTFQPFHLRSSKPIYLNEKCVQPLTKKFPDALSITIIFSISHASCTNTIFLFFSK